MKNDFTEQLDFLFSDAAIGTKPTKALAGAKQATNNEALAWLGWALHIVRDRCPDVLTSHQYDCAEQAYKSGFDPSGRAKDEVLARENEDLKRRLAELEKQQQQPVNERLVEALLYWRDECRGAEPSLSVFARMVDEALAAAEAQQAEPANERVIGRTWARFCGPDAPYPGMIEAFETHYGQSFRDKDWRTEAACWAAAWHKAVLVANPQAEPVRLTDEQVAKVDTAICEALGEAYDCLRVWEAWGCGTMRPDDFILVADDSDRVVEIREAVLLAANGLIEGAEPLKAEPVPVEAIGRLLTEAMDKAVENGASSVSMPDDYVAVAAWLCRVDGADNG